MANRKHLAALRQGVDSFNRWREQNLDIAPDVSRANLSGAKLREADLSEANLSDANLSGTFLGDAYLLGANLSGANLGEAHLDEANLFRANLSKANLSGAMLCEAYLFRANLFRANLRGANLSGANLSGANLGEANLSEANLYQTKLTRADLRGATLERANLTETDLEATILTGCRIYGLSAWNINVVGARQENLVITSEDEATITVDNLEIAQFIYLLLNNRKIRDVIDTITSKVVLILGRFTPERKAVLDALREKLKRRNYLPVLFDFDKPTSRNLTETVSTLAHMARFVIADITDVRSIPQELMAIVPHLPSVPVQPILLASDRKYGMFEDLQDYTSVLDPFIYDDRNALLVSLDKLVIQIAMKIRARQEAKVAKP